MTQAPSLISCHRLPGHRKKYSLIVTSPPYYKHRKYGDDVREMGRESSDSTFVERLIALFAKCRRLLRDDGSLWVVIGDSRRNYGKLSDPSSSNCGFSQRGLHSSGRPHLAQEKLHSSGSQINFSQAYEYVLFFSKYSNCFTNMDLIRTKGNEVKEGRNKEPAPKYVTIWPNSA